MLDFCNSKQNYLSQDALSLSPKIVEMPISIRTRVNKESEAILTLLIDRYCFIQDYKIHFRKIFLETTTTAQHKISKADNKSFLIRKKICEEIYGHHEFSNAKRNPTNKHTVELNQSQIDAVNNLFSNEWKYFDEYKYFTFKNIVYVLCGCNPGGEGANPSSGQITTLVKNKEYVVGMILKAMTPYKGYSCLNLNDLLNNPYVPKISFNEYVDKYFDPVFRSYFDFFQLGSKNRTWSNKVKELRERSKYYSKVQNTIICEVKKHESILNKKIINQFKNREEYFHWFWNSTQDHPEVAHIKPKFLIKEQSIKILRRLVPNNSSSIIHIPTDVQMILNGIDDLDNCLPLCSDIHISYDRCNFYWREDGVLMIKNNYNLPNSSFSKYKIVSKIPAEKLSKKMINFLQERNEHSESAGFIASSEYVNLNEFLQYKTL